MNNLWKILIVDDDEQIHLMTTLVLQDITFQGRSIELLSAYSASEAKSILEQDSDIALIMMDVVMETEHAGLELVRYIRDELKNMRVRIILRTGQPGTAPEKRIIIEYDINDYKEKTELTFQKLFTTVIASLRTYDYISQLETQRENLEHMLHLNSTLFSHAAQPENIIQNLYSFLNNLINKEHYPIRALIGLESKKGSKEIKHRIGEKEFNTEEEKKIMEDFSSLEEAYTEKEKGTYFILRLRDPLHAHLFLYLDVSDYSRLPDTRLFMIFTNSLKIAFSNISLQEEILNTQKDIITTLTEFIERRSTETASHVFRVSLYCHILGKLAGLNEKELSLLEIAAPMHDLGKVGISDSILKNPGNLSEKEYELMKEHTRIGHDILNKSNRKILKAASVISLQHHEYWDGTGYPAGLKGEEIDIKARVVTMVDVFDALQSKRSYKEAWSDQKIISYIRQERGKIFDPHLADLFLENYSKFREIADAYPDDSGKE